MEPEALLLAQLLVKKLELTAPTHRLLVGISGIPASGKTTFAQLLCKYTNNLLERVSNEGDSAGNSYKQFNKELEQAVVVGLDGWHLTRAQLDEFPDRKLAYDRRGIHWTFDGPGYVTFVHRLRAEITPESPIIKAPSFDHALKDPAPDTILIYPFNRIVIIEGLYTFLSIDPWIEGGRLLDERWFIQLSIEDAQRRLVKRHVVSGVAKDVEEAIWRSEQNDMPNGRFIIENMLEPTRKIQSREDPALNYP